MLKLQSEDRERNCEKRQISSMKMKKIRGISTRKKEREVEK